MHSTKIHNEKQSDVIEDRSPVKHVPGLSRMPRFITVL